MTGERVPGVGWTLRGMECGKCRLCEKPGVCGDCGVWKSWSVSNGFGYVGIIGWHKPDFFRELNDLPLKLFEIQKKAIRKVSVRLQINVFV